MNDLIMFKVDAMYWENMYDGIESKLAISECDVNVLRVVCFDCRLVMMFM